MSRCCSSPRCTRLPAPSALHGAEKAGPPRNWSRNNQRDLCRPGSASAAGSGVPWSARPGSLVWRVTVLGTKRECLASPRPETRVIGSTSFSTPGTLPGFGRSAGDDGIAWSMSAPARMHRFLFPEERKSDRHRYLPDALHGWWLNARPPRVIDQLDLLETCSLRWRRSIATPRLAALPRQQPPLSSGGMPSTKRQGPRARDRPASDRTASTVRPIFAGAALCCEGGLIWSKSPRAGRKKPEAIARSTPACGTYASGK